MFNVNEYVNTMKVTEDDADVIREANDLVKLSEVILTDGYLARAHHWGVATAMENQLSYLGGTLLPSRERKLQTLQSPTGILAETDLRVSFTSNEDHRHINEDTLVEDDIADAEAFIDQVQSKMRVAGIMYAIFVKAHDDQSMLLNQLSYGAIKAKANANRQARSA